MFISGTLLFPDYIKRELVNASGGELLADIVSRCKHEKDEESVYRMSVSADLVVLLLVEGTLSGVGAGDCCWISVPLFSST